jgi:polysaccharide biosynthesis/export protein
MKNRWNVLLVGLLLGISYGCATVEEPGAAGRGEPRGALSDSLEELLVSDAEAGQWIQLNMTETGYDVNAERTWRTRRPEGAYVLGVGDVLNISIYGQLGSLRMVPIDPSGHISYMLVGRVKAAGLTIDQLHDSMQEKLDAQLNYAIINIVPVYFGSQTYAILGMMNAPSVYPLRGRTTILDALCESGGFREGLFRESTVDLANLSRATLIRDGEVVPVDFNALVHEGDGSQNVEILPGDIIHVPSSLEKRIYALGGFNNPRSIEFYNNSITVVEAIIGAGGLRSYTKDGHVLVVRGNPSHPKVMLVDASGLSVNRIDTKKILRGKGLNTVLQPGDIVYAPPARFKFMRELVQEAIASFTYSVVRDSGGYMYQRLDPLDTGRAYDPSEQ